MVGQRLNRDDGACCRASTDAKTPVIDSGAKFPPLLLRCTAASFIRFCPHPLGRAYSVSLKHLLVFVIPLMPESQSRRSCAAPDYLMRTEFAKPAMSSRGDWPARVSSKWPEQIRHTAGITPIYTVWAYEGFGDYCRIQGSDAPVSSGCWRRDQTCLKPSYSEDAR